MSDGIGPGFHACAARIVLHGDEDPAGLVVRCIHPEGHTGPHRARLRAVDYDVPDDPLGPLVQWYPLTWWGMEHDG
jgi:hypothetical protein